MPDPIRHHYVIELGHPPGAAPWLDFEVDLRAPKKSDMAMLAELMLDAYRGTIDYVGESTEDARAEVSDFFNSSPRLGASHVAIVENSVAGAILVSTWHDEPLIAHVMTRPKYRNRGLGTLLLRASLSALRDQGEERVHAFITDGNTASEALFAGAGAKLVSEA